MTDNTIYEPLKMYESTLKNKVAEETKRSFDQLIKDSHVNRLANKDAVNKYNKSVAVANEADKKLQSVKNWRTFLIILAVIFIVIGVCFFMALSTDSGSKVVKILVGIAGIVLGIVIFVLVFTKMNKIIKNQNEVKAKLDEKVANLFRVCQDQTNPLCALLDWNIASKIIRKAVPMIQLDDYFDMKKLDLLKNKYGFLEDTDEQTSIQLVQSGSVVGNPFLLVRASNQGMGTKTYSGSIVISWTERERDSDGNTRYVTRTQTLVATVSKPCPIYGSNTYLVYGNEAAPGLKFSRKPTGLKQPTEKQVDRYVKSKEDDIQRYADKAVSENRTFTPLANIDFEALFGGWDRNNEVEYRLLFTALAQQNEIDLITKNKYFGDDFYFQKNGELNYIASNHMQGFDIYQAPYKFYSHDIDEMEAKLNDYVNEYFKNVFFELAPVLSIPLYQQHKPIEFIYKNKYNYNNTTYECESLANSLPRKYFTPEGAATQSILKATPIQKCGKSDKVKVVVHAFRTEPRVDYVSRMGGDGHMHQIPVYWDEYIPIEQESMIAVKDLGITKQQYGNKLENMRQVFGSKVGSDEIVFERGLIAFIINEAFGENDDTALDKIFDYNHEKGKEDK